MTSHTDRGGTYVSLLSEVEILKPALERAAAAKDEWRGGQTGEVRWSENTTEGGGEDRVTKEETL